MKPEKLVEACTTNTELAELVYAAVDSVGAKRSFELAWDRFLVNGDERERATAIQLIREMFAGIEKQIDEEHNEALFEDQQRSVLGRFSTPDL